MKQNVFGLDISDRSAEVLALIRKKGEIQVAASARIELPPGAIQNGVIIEADEVARAIAKLLDNAFGVRRGALLAGVSLPEITVFSRVFTFPAKLEPRLLAEAVALEAADNFPLPIQRAVTAFSVIGRTPEAQLVHYAAVDREVANGYMTLLKRLGVQPLFLDAESMALARALVDPLAQEPTLIVDIGARTTHFVVCDRGTVRSSGTVMIGGDALTAAIEHKLGIALQQAEEMRRQSGFDPEANDGRVLLIVEGGMSDIMYELRRTVEFYEGQSGRAIGAIILAGGTSLMPQIGQYVATHFPGKTVTVGDPFAKIAIPLPTLKSQLKQTAVLWATSVGLALRAIGARASPGLNLIPRPSARGNAFAKISNVFSNLLSMVTRPKKSASGKSEDLASGTPSTPPPSEPTPQAAPAAPAKPAAASEKDYGGGIGDILGGVPAAKTAAASGKAPAPVAAKRSIESVLGETAPATRPTRPMNEARPRTSAKGRTVTLFILMLICIAAAAAGVISFARKSGLGMPGGLSLPSGLTSWLPQRGAPESAPATGSETRLPETVSAEVLISVNPIEGETRLVLPTRLIETDVTASGTFPATGVSAGVPGKSSGRATIVNTTAKSFNFVATTRLLSAEGVLFRIKAATAIPANGEAEVDVVADQVGAAGDVGPTNFTVPGLSAELQKQVYARSSAAMTGGAPSTTGVSDDDIKAAKAALSEKLRADGETALKAMAIEGEAVSSDLVTMSEVLAEAPAAGTPGSEFALKLTLRYKALLVPTQAIQPLLDAALAAAGSAGEADSYGFGDPLYVVQAYPQPDRAELRVEAPIVKK